MKTALKLLLVLTVVFFGWAYATYPKVGAIAFSSGAVAEARLYGLNKQIVNIGEMDMMTYQGGPEDGEAIVMVHGYTADKNVWPRFARHFTDKYRVIIPDLAGHGETEFNPQWDYSIGAQAARIAALLDKLGITKAHIIGNSMGGAITGYFAIHYPERTLTAAPLDPGAVKSPEPSDMEKMLAEGKNPFLIETTEDFLAFYPMTMAKAPWLPGFVLDAVAEQYIERKQRYEQIFGEIITENLAPDLHKLKLPVLLVWGDQDRLLHVSTTQVWKAEVPQIQIEIMEGIGHMPMVEVPAETAEIYQAFLDKAAS